MPTLSLLFSVLVCASQASPPASPPRYRITELTGSPHWHATAYDVNERRTVVGTLDFGLLAREGEHPALWAPDGSVLDLAPSSNYQFGRANSINNAGVVAGSVITPDAAPEGGFRWRDGQLELLPTPFQMDALHVDERGYVGGQAHTPRFQFAPTVWAPDLSYVQLPGLGGGHGMVDDINGWGDAVGWDMLVPTGSHHHAFVEHGGQTHDLGTLPGHLDSLALAINVKREVVGFSGPPLAQRAVRWRRDGTIEALPRGVFSETTAQDINDHGTIVGWGGGSSGRVALVWIDGELHRLADLVDDLAGRILVQANAINERGDIAGILTSPQGGLWRPFLATRVDGGHPAVIGPWPAVAGGTSAIELVGLTPWSVVALYLGLREGNTPAPGCPGDALEIHAPRVEYLLADASGNARVDVRLPSSVRGRTVLLQAFEVGRCRKTSLAVIRLD